MVLQVDKERQKVCVGFVGCDKLWHRKREGRKAIVINLIYLINVMNLNDQEDALIEELRFSGIEEDILEAMKKVKREFFVLKEDLNNAYENIALPLGYNSTISQPYTVAIMLQELELKRNLNVLEIGTGSGWNVSLIGYLIGKKGMVYTTEVNEKIIKLAKKNIKNNGIKNIKFFYGDVLKKDLFKGLKFDRIIVTAAAYETPKKLIKMLKNNGVLLCPVGKEVQKLVKIKKKNNKLIKKYLGDFIFVRLKE